MTNDPRFLTTSEVIEIHDQEIATAVGLSGVYFCTTTVDGLKLVNMLVVK
jgi:hypothetical protein